MTSRVLITGLGAVTPLGLDLASTWENLIKGVSGVDHISSFDASQLGVRFAAEVKGYDPETFFGHKEARRMDRFTQFAATAAQQACAQASLDMSKLDPYRVAVVLGSGVGGILSLYHETQTLLERGAKRVSPFLMPMMLIDMAPAKISMMLGAKGANVNVASACSSSADAIGQAWHMIKSGEVDVVIAGGSEAPLCPIGIAGFDNMRALSRMNDAPARASRPFDKDRDGFVMGEGAGILVLESEDSVRRRGARPLAELAGYGTTSDAHHVVEPAPQAASAATAMKWAMERAGLRPEEVGYINAHGTSTPLNDSIESRAIKQALGDAAYRVPISSTKSMLGHALGAAGAIEAVISVQVLLEGVIPPTINLDNPDPECDLDYTPHRARKVDVQSVLSNSFGFGGHNSVLAFKTAREG